jgi:anti-sigma regulatory factor (Ser/Thr protein kinase)
VSNRLTVRAGSPACARHIVRSTLSAESNVSADAVERAVLLTSELVTNAIVHASEDPTLLLDVRENTIHIEVVDSEPTVELASRNTDVMCERGRGLAIVDALASAWGVEPRLVGKAVWFELHL